MGQNQPVDLTSIWILNFLSNMNMWDWEWMTATMMIYSSTRTHHTKNIRKNISKILFLNHLYYRNTRETSKIPRNTSSLNDLWCVSEYAVHLDILIWSSIVKYKNSLFLDRTHSPLLCRVIVVVVDDRFFVFVVLLLDYC